MRKEKETCVRVTIEVMKRSSSSVCLFPLLYYRKEMAIIQLCERSIVLRERINICSGLQERFSLHGRRRWLQIVTKRVFVLFLF